MSLHDYTVARDLADRDTPFDALIMAAMRRGDTFNSSLLAQAFPQLWTELLDRYHAPGGLLPTDGAPAAADGGAA